MVSIHGWLMQLFLGPQQDKSTEERHGCRKTIYHMESKKQKGITGWAQGQVISFTDI